MSAMTPGVRRIREMRASACRCAADAAAGDATRKISLTGIPSAEPKGTGSAVVAIATTTSESPGILQWGIAIPHCKMPGLSDVVVAMATTAEPIPFGAADGIPVRLIFLVASPAAASAAHLQALARISRILRTPGVIADIDAASSAERFLEIVRHADVRGTA